MGLTAKRATMGWPVEMPPRMPPAWLDRNTGLPIDFHLLAHAHLVGIVFAGHGGGGKAVADLHALDRVDAHQGAGQFIVQLGIDRRPQAGGNAFRHHFDDGAHR